VLFQRPRADRVQRSGAGLVRGLLQRQQRVDSLPGRGHVARRPGPGDGGQLAQQFREFFPAFAARSATCAWSSASRQVSPPGGPAPGCLDAGARQAADACSGMVMVALAGRLVLER